MIPLKEYIQGPVGLPSLLPYFGIISEGIILNHDGSLTAGFYYEGPDMDSCLDEEKFLLSLHLNQVFSRLGTGWSIHVNTMRLSSSSYPENHFFGDPLLKLIENKRRHDYESGVKHFETMYSICFTKRPEEFHTKKFEKLFAVKRDKKLGDLPGMESFLSRFQEEIADIEAGLKNRLKVERMGSKALLEFLGYCITGERSPLLMPSPPVYLNHYLGKDDFIGGQYPKIGDYYLGIAALVGFPNQSSAGMLEFLNQFSFEYRVSNRFICLDECDAEDVLKNIRHEFNLKQFDVRQAIFDSLSQNGMSHHGHFDAESKEDEVNHAIAELQAGSIKYGYYTSNVIVHDTDQSSCQAKIQWIKNALVNQGFFSKIETINAVEAFMGSLPGEFFANVRKPLIHTLNLSHLAPMTSVWAGEEFNPNPYLPELSPPVFFGSTSGSTPFRFNTHWNDVGHTLIFGPTGSGKSTLLGLMSASFFRYEGAQVFFFDKGYSQYALAKACGAGYYDILGDHSSLAFCPLHGIESESDAMWAAEWIEILLNLQGMSTDPNVRSDIYQAIHSLKHSQSKTLSDFFATVQNREIKKALEPYVDVCHGAMAGLLDADQDSMMLSNFQVFEMENLMQKEERFSVPVLLYIFHQIEKRLDGRPSLLVLDEAWLMLKNPLFSSKIEEWLRTLRKKNAAVVFATNSIGDVQNSPIRYVVNENCVTKVYLPSATAASENVRPIYESFGLNGKQINIIRDAIPKRQYYYTSLEGSRLFELGLSDLELSFVGVNSKYDRKRIDELFSRYGREWVPAWLEERSLYDSAKEWRAIHQDEGREGR